VTQIRYNNVVDKNEQINIINDLDLKADKKEVA